MIVPSETSYLAARSVGTGELRTLDALHLTAALELGNDLWSIVTYDRRLAAGADHHRITVVAPGLSTRWWQ